MRFVLLGGGIASLTCARKLRELKPQDEILIISEEKYPYSRMVLPNILKKEITFEDAILTLPPGVEFRGESKVISVDFERKVVCTVREELKYDKLLVATGSKAYYPFEKRYDSVVTVRNIEDVWKIEKYIESQGKIIVYGAGFVSLEMADALIHRGIAPKVLVSSDYPLSGALDRESGNFLKDLLLEKGIDFEFRKSIKEVEESFIITNNGEKIPCDLLIAGKGVMPADEFIKKVGGLKVNEFLETEFEDVYAAGDVAEVYDIVYEKHRMNAIWPVASETGWYAALNMAGVKTPYHGSFPRNAIKILGIEVITGGAPKCEGDEELIFKKGNKFARAVLEEGVLRGFVLINVKTSVNTLLELLRTRKKVGDRFKRQFPFICPSAL